MIYQWLRRFWYSLVWTDPLVVARKLLYKTVSSHAHYAHGVALDIGCGVKPYAQIFEGRVTMYLGLDLPPNPQANVHADGQGLPFKVEAFDFVLCNEVLEHVPEPSQLIANVYRVLKPGGVLLLTTPQTWGLHHEPRDFYRYTSYGLRYLAEKNGLEIIEVVPTSGFWATFAQRLSDVVIHNYAARSPLWLIAILSLLLAPVLMIGYGLDRVIGKSGDTLDNVLVARKPTGIASV